MNRMYDMYPARWRVVDDDDRGARRHRPTNQPERPGPVQEAMNRRDNGGEPTQ